MIQLGYGWLDEAPALVKKVVSTHEQNGNSCVLEVHAETQMETSPSMSIAVFNDQNGNETETLKRAGEVLANFLTLLKNPFADAASLVFVNLNASRFPFKTPPNPKRLDFDSVADGLRSFLAWANASIDGISSACEWVMLSCLRGE